MRYVKRADESREQGDEIKQLGLAEVFRLRRRLYDLYR